MNGNVITSIMIMVGIWLLISININGIAAELKRASSHNNILNYAKKAIFKQNAKIVLFEFVEMSACAVE